LAKVTAVSITDIQSERALDFTVVADTTAEWPVGSASIVRTIRVTLTPEFEAANPTDNLKYKSLLGAFKSAFSSRIPGTILEAVVVPAP
jgi:hypothetical protein